MDSNEGIAEAFATAGSFDVVITDIYRDAVGDRRVQPKGGLETVKIIKGQHGSVPVIISAGSYAASHANDPLQAPVIAITNDPRVCFRSSDRGRIKEGQARLTKQAQDASPVREPQLPVQLAR